MIAPGKGHGLEKAHIQPAGKVESSGNVCRALFAAVGAPAKDCSCTVQILVIRLNT